MSVLPKLYSAWPYKQLLQAIHDDAVHFGVNSPEPTTSRAPASQPSTVIGNTSQPSTVIGNSTSVPAQQVQQPPSPCRPTVVRYEPPTFSLEVPAQMLTRAERNQVLQNHVAAANATFSKVAVLEDLIQQEPHNASHYKEVQRVQCNQHIQVAIKLQLMLEADDKLRETSGLPQLDLPEYLWMVRNMNTAQTREEHFMAISSEIEVLCQQLKGKGLYPTPSTHTQTVTKQNVHFQPIQPAQASPLQPQDRLLFDPLLDTTKGSTRLQSSSDNESLPCGQTTQQESLHTPSPRFQQPAVPPTPYVNQTAVEQHAKTQSPPVPPRSTATVSALHQESPASDTQEPLITFATLPQAPPQAQEQSSQLSMSPLGKRTKSKNGHGVKQAKNGKATANDGAPVCWRCGKQGHLKKDCPRPPFCGKCKKEGHVPALCPLRRSQGSVRPSPHQHQDNRFSNPTNRCIHCGGEHKPASCPAKYQHKPMPSTSSYVSPQQNTKGSQSTTGSTRPTLLINNNTTAQVPVRGNQSQQVTPQVSPNVQQNIYTPNVIPPVQQSNQFPPPPYFPIPFPPPPVPPSNVSVAPSAPASDLSAAITLMTNAVNQGNTNTTAIMDALQRTTTQFADALQQTI